MNYFAMPGLKVKKKFRPTIKQQEHIMRVITEYFDTNMNEITKKTREHKIVMIRHISFYFLRKYTTITLNEIACMFKPAVKDHTTVIHGVNHIHDQLHSKFDNDVKFHIQNIHI